MESFKEISLATVMCHFLQEGLGLFEELEATAKRGISDTDLERGISQLQLRVTALADEIVEPGFPELTMAPIARECFAVSEEIIAKLNTPSLKKPKSALAFLRAGAQPNRKRFDVDDVNELKTKFRDCLLHIKTQLVNTLRHDAHERLDHIITSGQVLPGEIEVLQSNFAAIRLIIQYPLIGNGIVSVLGALMPRLVQAIAVAQQTAILNVLKFQGINERYASITEAEARTFNWLLDDTEGDEDGNSTDNEATIQLDKALIQARRLFIEWLTNGHGYFYLSGKPGAGKSTLMKFICRHENFYRAAKVWSRNSTVLVGRFFFWKPGQPEQKSINGLLRGLLHSILETSPAIAAIAFPELCNGPGHSRLESVVIKHQDIERAFENVLKNAAATGDYNVILAIDGLDEFEGEHAKLLDLMKSWVGKYKFSIKICISSREYGIFEEFFAGCPRFRLHELTHDDMSHLITSRLKNNRFFSSLPAEEAKPIKTMISERAEGVFLWVVMVVAAIDDGLMSGAISNAAELEKYIRFCPSELDDLLHHLLMTVTIRYRVWAFKAISLVQFTQFKVPEILQSSQNCPGVGLLDIMALDESSPKWDMSAFQPRSESKSPDIPARLEGARKKILGRCKGFVSIITISDADLWPANRDERMYAAITHRSIVEFLDSEAAVGHMERYLSGLSGFNPYFALFSTMLACLRFLEPSNYPLIKPAERLPQKESLRLCDVLEDSLQDRLRDLIQCALSLGHSGSPRFLSLLDSVGDAVKRHLTIQLSTRGIKLSSAEASPHELLITLTLRNRVYEYSEWRRRENAKDGRVHAIDLRLSEAFHDVLRYFRSNDSELPVSDQAGGRSPTDKPIDRIKWDVSLQKTLMMPADRFSSLLTEFVERGLDLNYTPSDDCGPQNGSLTIEEASWTCWQALIWAMLVGDIPYTNKYAELIDQLVKHGADPDIVIISCPPLDSLHVEWLAPQDEWVLLVPFAKEKPSLECLVKNYIKENNDESRRKYHRMPAALIRESAPLYMAAKPKNWVFTLRDLVALWFPDDGNYFDCLFGSVSKMETNEWRSMPSLSHPVRVDAGILGEPRGSCDLGSYLQGMRVHAETMDT